MQAPQASRRVYLVVSLFSLVDKDESSSVETSDRPDWSVKYMCWLYQAADAMGHSLGVLCRQDEPKGRHQL